MGAVIGIL